VTFLELSVNLLLLSRLENKDFGNNRILAVVLSARPQTRDFKAQEHETGHL
jgi:hypothetical protein